jgi:hypothetical protein
LEQLCCVILLPCGGVLGAVGLFFVFMRKAVPKKAPELYATPEIEIETFSRGRCST